jgi:hypothetical protein
MTTRKERSTICETCGETNKDKLLAFKPICRICRKKDYKKNYHKIYYQKNKNYRCEKNRYNKRIKTLKRYCFKLNKDFNDYLKDKPTLEELIKINESLRPLVYPPKEPRTCFYCLRKKVTYHYNLQKFLCTPHYTQKDTEYRTEQELKQKNKELYLDPVRYKEHLTSEFIKKVETKFGVDVIDFNQLDYINKNVHIELTCKKNNHTFKTTPNNFLKVSINPCPVCTIGGDKTDRVNKYINLAIEKYGDQFDYSLVNYTSKRLPVTIKCNKHNMLFDQIIYNHAVVGSIGCPNCHIEKTNKRKPSGTGINKRKTSGIDTINYIPYKKSTEYKIKRNLQKRIRDAIKRKHPTEYITPTEEILGCKIEFFKEHLESKFEPWMTWENYGLYNGEFNYGWDIDHVIPLSQANTVDELYELNHYENLQPLCSKVNRDIKGARLDFEHSDIPEISG